MNRSPDEQRSAWQHLQRKCFSLQAGALLPAVVFLFFLFVYALTAQRGLSWQDSGEFQYRVFAGDYRWYAGIARSHPLYLVLTRAVTFLFPSSLRAYAVTFSSGIGMATALAFLFSLVRRTGDDTARGNSAGLLAVLMLGLSQMGWWMSCMAEVYTWSLACLMAEVYCLARVTEKAGGSRWFCLLFLVNGLHASIHNFALLDLPVLLVLLLFRICSLRRKENPFIPILRLSLLCAFGWCLGAGFLLVLFFLEWRTGGSLIQAGKSLLFGYDYAPAVMGTVAIRWKLVAANLALAGVSFMNPAWLLSFARPAAKKETRCFSPSFYLSLLTLTLFHLLFWVRYFVADQATFVLPTLGLLAVWTGLGAARGNFSARYLLQVCALSAMFSVFVPLVFSKALRLHDFGLLRGRSLPGREEFSYWLLPWKCGENSAERFVRRVGDGRQAGDVVISDNTAASPLMAAQECGRLSKDWRVVSAHDRLSAQEIQRLLSDAPRAFVVSPKPGYAVCDEVLLNGKYRFVRDGVLYRILPVHN